VRARDERDSLLAINQASNHATARLPGQFGLPENLPGRDGEGVRVLLHIGGEDEPPFVGVIPDTTGPARESAASPGRYRHRSP
jgi:hypothetical protein